MERKGYKIVKRPLIIEGTFINAIVNINNLDFELDLD
jgi:hypothetical protein